MKKRNLLHRLGKCINIIINKINCLNQYMRDSIILGTSDDIFLEI